MSLPNYFFADLPPEATLSPAMVSSAVDTLKRNREKFLRPRSTDNIIRILCDAGADWLRPESKFRRMALEQGPEQTRYSKAVLERGLDSFFRLFTEENFYALLEQELGDRQRLDEFVAVEAGRPAAMAHGPAFLVHVAAGNLPNPALMSLVLGLLTRSAQFMKCASGGSFLPRLFAHTIYEHDPKLGACLELAEWRGGNLALENVLFAAADCLTATGSDESLNAIRARLPVKTRFLDYGHRASLGYVTREVLREEEIAGVISRAADDIVAWDQNGCLSPHVIYVEERGAVESDKFAKMLAVELAGREAVESRGAISVEAAADISSRRATYETLAAHRGDIKIWSSPNSTAWTVVFEHDVRFRFSPLNRFIYVKPVPDVAVVLQGLDDVQGKISTVGLAAPPEKMKEVAFQLVRWGVARVCPLGGMQTPPLTWRHDGRPALGDLVTWSDFEL